MIIRKIKETNKQTKTGRADTFVFNSHQIKQINFLGDTWYCM